MALDLSVSLSEYEGEVNGSSKIINDPVHGHISIPRYSLEFIGTQFDGFNHVIAPIIYPSLYSKEHY